MGHEDESDSEGSCDEADLPLRLFRLLVRHSPGATAVVESLLGRSVRGRILAQDEIALVRPPGLVRLQTTGPVLHRHVVLEDSAPPHLPVAVAWALVVSKRLSAELLAALRDEQEPLDRLLSVHRVPWSAEPLDTEVTTVADASIAFPWAAPTTPLVEQSRLVLIQGSLPVAAVIDEIPFLMPRTDPAGALVARPTPPCSAEAGRAPPPRE